MEIKPGDVIRYNGAYGIVLEAPRLYMDRGKLYGGPGWSGVLYYRIRLHTDPLDKDRRITYPFRVGETLEPV
jgi:hypothetical protein